MPFRSPSHESFIKDVVLLILLLPILLSAGSGGYAQRPQPVHLDVRGGPRHHLGLLEVMLEWGFPTLFTGLRVGCGEGVRRCWVLGSEGMGHGGRRAGRDGFQIYRPASAG